MRRARRGKKAARQDQIAEPTVPPSFVFACHLTLHRSWHRCPMPHWRRRRHWRTHPRRHAMPRRRSSRVRPCVWHGLPGHPPRLMHRPCRMAPRRRRRKARRWTLRWGPPWRGVAPHWWRKACSLRHHSVLRHRPPHRWRTRVLRSWRRWRQHCGRASCCCASCDCSRCCCCNCLWSSVIRLRASCASICGVFVAPSASATRARPRPRSGSMGTSPVAALVGGSPCRFAVVLGMVTAPLLRRRRWGGGCRRG